MKYCIGIILSLFMSAGPQLTGQQTVGTFIDTDEATQGYTFFTPRRTTQAFMIDNCGREINRWSTDYMAGLGGYFLETGQALHTGKYSTGAFQQTSTGGIVQLLSWDNEVDWEYILSNDSMIQHHDASYMPNGNILFLGWEKVDVATQIAWGREPVAISNPHLWSEFVQEIKPTGQNTGEVVWEWHMWDHFIQDYDSTKINYGNISDYPELIDINYAGPGWWSRRDWWHCNAIDYNPDRDEVLINSRNNNEVWIIDHSTTTQEAASHSGGVRGKGGDLIYRWGNPAAYTRGTSENLRMFGSHGVNWIDDGLPNSGRIIYFNNGEGRPQGDYSTAESIQPEFDENGDYLMLENGTYAPGEPEVHYGNNPPFSLQSTYLSNAHQMPNGNVFINEGGSGRLLEANSAGEVVWEYRNPVYTGGILAQGQNSTRNDIFRAYKFESDFIGLQGLDLTPGDVLEINSDIFICNMTSPNSPTGLLDHVTIIHDFTNQQLSIENQENLEIEIDIHAATGKFILGHKTSISEWTFDTSDLSPGMYIVRSSLKGIGFMSKKIIVQ